MSDVIGRAWPEWHVESLLGQGSFGSVYRATRNGHGHTSHAAIKVIEIPQDPREVRDLASSGMDEASVRSYFEHRARYVLSEVALMEELKGAPNVVSVEDYQLLEHDDGIGWTVLVRMPLLEPVNDYFARSGQPDPLEVARLGSDVCQALSACHAKGVIHRDVKPENIFRGPYGYLLGDFGIARRLGPDAGSAHTRAGAYPYMAPEVFAGRGYGPNVDTYSLGLVLYRYLNNGRAPFLLSDGAFSPSDSERAVALRLSGRDLPAPANADEQLASIVLRAADPKPEARFGSATEMSVALEKWLRGKTAVPAPAGQADPIIGSATVVLDPEATSAKSPATQMPQGTTASDQRRGQTVVPSTSTPQATTAAQESFGTSGTVWAEPSAQSDNLATEQLQGHSTDPSASQTHQPANPQNQVGASSTPHVFPSATSKQMTPGPKPTNASAKDDKCSSTSNSTGNLHDWRLWAAVAVAIVAAVAIAALLFGPLSGGSGHSGSTPTPQESESNSDSDASSSEQTASEDGSAGGTPIKPGSYLIDDDVCTIKITDISFADNGDLRFYYTLTNHTDRTLDVYVGVDEEWTVNGSSVDCIFCPTVDPGETTDDFFHIEGNSLPTSNLDEIYSVEGSVRIDKVDTRYYDASIPDSPSHSKDGFAGSLLADDDICTVEVTGTYFDSEGYLHVGVTYVNHTNEILDFYNNGLWAVNGVYAEAVFADTVDPGATSDDDFFIEPDTLPVTDVDEIESIAGSFTVDISDRSYYDVSV